MNKRSGILLRTAVLALAGLLAGGPAVADKPRADDDERKAVKAEKKKARHHDRRDDERHRTADWRFDDHNRRIVDDYYGPRFRSGKCPPGLAKKNNGCLPPGQAKKWAVGAPLPAGVVYYRLPRTLLLQLPPPPPQHRYVRIATDILLIAIGTNMVIDAIEDIGRR